VDVAVDRGEGPYLYATTAANSSISPAGSRDRARHCHPHVVAALSEQAKRLWHTSNLFRIPGQERLAQRLVDSTFADTVFFGNSGAEACELAIKIARKYQSETRFIPSAIASSVSRLVPWPHLRDIGRGGKRGLLKGFGPPMDGL